MSWCQEVFQDARVKRGRRRITFLFYETDAIPDLDKENQRIPKEQRGLALLHISQASALQTLGDTVVAALGTTQGVVVSRVTCVPRHHHISSGETNHLVRSPCFMVFEKREHK